MSRLSGVTCIRILILLDRLDPSNYQLVVLVFQLGYSLFQHVCVLFQLSVQEQHCSGPVRQSSGSLLFNPELIQHNNNNIRIYINSNKDSNSKIYLCHNFSDRISSLSQNISNLCSRDVKSCEYIELMLRNNSLIIRVCYLIFQLCNLACVHLLLLLQKSNLHTRVLEIRNYDCCYLPSQSVFVLSAVV